MAFSRGLLVGAAAGAIGAVGTTALNAATYLDTAVRSRPASSALDDAINAVAGKLGPAVLGDEDVRRQRTTGLHALDRPRRHRLLAR